MPENDEDGVSVSLRKAYLRIVIISTAALVALYITILILSGHRGDFPQLAYNHAGTAFGIPCAAMVSLALVLLLRTVSGNIQFKALGFEFKGASGPIIMWILCFLSLVLAIVKTWPLTSK